MSKNIRYNKVDDIIDKKMKFDSNYGIPTPIRDPQPLVTFNLKLREKYRKTNDAGLTYMWYSGVSNIIIKRKQKNTHKSKIIPNKLEYGTVASTYCTTHDVKNKYFITYFSIRKITKHQFHVDESEGGAGIGYDMIIGCDLRVKLGIIANFKHRVL